MQIIFELVIRYDYTLFNPLNRLCKGISMNYLLPSLGCMIFNAGFTERTYLNKNLVSIKSSRSSYTYLNGKLHSYNDKPAQVTNMMSVWYKNGEPYREKKPFKIKKFRRKGCSLNTNIYYWNRTGNEVYMMHEPFRGEHTFGFKDFIIDYLTMYTNKKLSICIGDKLHVFDLKKDMEKQFEGKNKTQIVKFLKEAIEAPDMMKHFKVTDEYIK